MARTVKQREPESDGRAGTCRKGQNRSDFDLRSLTNQVRKLSLPDREQAPCPPGIRLLDSPWTCPDCSPGHGPNLEFDTRRKEAARGDHASGQPEVPHG